MEAPDGNVNSRRHFLRLAILGGSAALLAACSAPAPSAPQPTIGPGNVPTVPPAAQPPAPKPTAPPAPTAAPAAATAAPAAQPTVAPTVQAAAGTPAQVPRN